MKISLKSARVNANFTQQEIADELRVSKHTIVNWEKGKTKVPFASLKMLCLLYDCSLDDIKY